MIKFEHNMLVLNNAFSEADVDEINAFADYVRTQEGKRILDVVIDVLMDTREDFLGGIKNGRDYDGWRLMIQGIEAGICNIVFGSGGHCPICRETHKKVEKI